jgi:hypothetical protein
MKHWTGRVNTLITVQGGSAMRIVLRTSTQRDTADDDNLKTVMQK